MEIINVSSYIEKYNMDNYTVQKISSFDSYNPAISTVCPVSQHGETFTNSHNYLLYK